MSHTNWGSWTSWQYCNSGDLAIGYKFSWEPYQGSGGGGNDDSGGNGFWLRCGNPKENSSYLKGSEGKWNVEWIDSKCDSGSYINGIRINSEYEGGDDMALTNVRLSCRNFRDGAQRKLPVSNAYNGKGYWSDEVLCPAWYGVYGVRVKREAYQGGGDDSMLNKIELRCRHILDFASAVIVN